jgi:MoxR-like ATPase
VEDAVRKAEESHWRRSNPEALSRAKGTVEQIRSAIRSLEGQLEKAQARGDEAAGQRAQEAIEARREWLAEAERTLAELSS